MINRLITLLIGVGLFAVGAHATEPVSEARALLSAGRFAEVIRLVEGTDELPQAKRALLLTHAYNGLDDWKRAIDAGERAVDAMPTSSEARLAYAEALRRKMQQVSRIRAMGSLGAYKRSLARAIELDPQNVEARSEQIGFLMEAPGIAGGDRKEARKKIEALEAFDPRRAAEHRAQLARAEGDRQGEIAARRALVERFPDDPQPRYDLGVALQGVEDFTRADPIFEALLDSDQLHIALAARYQLGRSRVLGDFEAKEAVAHFDRYRADLEQLAAELTERRGLPAAADALWRRGLAFEQLGEPDQARASYRRALASAPDHDQAREALAKLR